MATRATSTDDTRKTKVPFCSLPAGTRSDLVRGHRQGRSADVLVVATGRVSSIPTGTGQPASMWPSVSAIDLPLAFWGHGIERASSLDTTRLDSVAPTIADLMALERPHPEVRSGEASDGVVKSGVAPPRLVVVIGWRAVGPFDSVALAQAIRDGSGTIRARAGSLPLDPAAIFATVGTGGLPFQHGISGTLIRNEEGRAVEAFSEAAPTSVIAALGDDLDRATDGEARLALVGTTPSDRGLIGGNWYLERDDEEIMLVEGAMEEQVDAAIEYLRTPAGTGDVPDLFGVALTGEGEDLDRHLPRLERAAQRAAGGEASFVLVGVPVEEQPSQGRRVVDEAIERAGAPRDVVQGLGAGAIFLDQDVLAETGSSPDTLVAALRSAGRRDGTLADVFPSTVVAFEEYC